MDFLISASVYFTMLALFAAGALGALLLRRHDRAANVWSHWLAIAGSAAGLIFSGAVLYQGTTPAFGVISIAIPAFIIVVQNNYKRLFAYSSIEHMGIITLGLGFGGLRAFGALLHMIYHSLVKSALFFAAGNLLLKYGSTKILRVRGVLSVLPVTVVALMVGFLAITGMPPFGIFMTEFYILTAGVSAHMPVVIGVLLLLLLVFAGFLRHIVSMAHRTDAPPEQVRESNPSAVAPPESASVSSYLNVAQPETIGESNYLTVLPPVLLLILFVVASFYLPAPVKSLIDSAVSLING